MRIVGEAAPTAEAHAATPTLEDAYLYVIERHRNEAAL